MKLAVRDMDIATGGPLVATINHEDAAKLDLHEMDRIKLIKGKRVETVVTNIAKSSKTVRPGIIGLFDEVIDSLRLKDGDIVKIVPARKPLSIEYIRKKLDGLNLSGSELDQIVWDIVHNKLSQIEIAYFVAACYTNALSIGETIHLIRAMVKHGEILRLKKYPIIDKHCIGGIPGNRTTLVLVPMMAAAGLAMPKTSSRSITSPAGTADTMEVLAKVAFDISRMKKIILKANGCVVWGGALNLAPADDKIINVEKPLGIDAESQLVASIMSKKYSVSSTHILIDIPVGDDAKVKNRFEALKLKKNFEIIGKQLKKKIKVILTDGNQPIGNGIGPALEARDILWILTRDNRRPIDLEKKSLYMAACIFGMLGIKNGYKKALGLLESGKAYEKMVEIIHAQNGSIVWPDEIRIGKYSHDISLKSKGVVKDIDNVSISKIARIAGAPADKGAGLYLYKHIGDKVKRGEKLFTIYAENREKLKYAADVAKESRAYIIK
ncbi:AMP phosphorylase [Candidatus Woesearchaeota archaeon]|nr:AMP phosphorylase [Candidatus Woesearchaeota archaeon]